MQHAGHLSFNASCQGAVIKGYDAWASIYDDDMQRMAYRTPEALAALVAQCCPARQAHLLDVGAGTGLVGAALHRRGYRNVIGLDAARSMLREAAGKRIYRHLVCMVLGRRLALADHAFEGIVAGGVYTPGGAPLESLTEIDRLLGNGGWFFVSLKWDGLYEAQFQAAIETLFTAGQWRCRACSPVFSSWPGLGDGFRVRLLAYQIRQAPPFAAAG